MKKNWLNNLIVVAISLAVLTVPVWGSSVITAVQSEYTWINLTNFITTALPQTGTRGKLAYDSTANVPVFENATIWQRLLTSAGHLEFTQATGPTISGCATSFNTGSTDNAGSFTVSSATLGCIITPNAAWTNSPFCILTNTTDASNHTNTITHTDVATGITTQTPAGAVTGAYSVGSMIAYHCMGRYVS